MRELHSVSLCHPANPAKLLSPALHLRPERHRPIGSVFPRWHNRHPRGLVEISCRSAGALLPMENGRAAAAARASHPERYGGCCFPMMRSSLLLPHKWRTNRQGCPATCRSSRSRPGRIQGSGRSPLFLPAVAFVVQPDIREAGQDQQVDRAHEEGFGLEVRPHSISSGRP